jgi:hypothetical protein
MALIRQVHSTGPAAEAVTAENENHHSKLLPGRAKRSVEASYYRDFFARVWSADGHRYCNEPSHEDGTADEHHQRAAIAVSAGVLIHHFHAGLFGKSVQKTAVFRGDLHGSNVIARTL